MVAKVCVDLPRNVGHKVLSILCYTSKREGILAVGIITGNRIQGCPLVGNKEIEKDNCGDLDHQLDNNSGVIIVKWLDNNVVQLCSNFVGVCPMETIEQWVRKRSSQGKNTMPPNC